MCCSHAHTKTPSSRDKEITNPMFLRRPDVQLVKANEGDNFTVLKQDERSNIYRKKQIIKFTSSPIDRKNLS
jgi:hypothetical protein